MLLVLLALPWAVTAVSSWTFLAGDTQSYSSGSAVLPGARRSATCWVDSRTNRLVLFGGQGVDSEVSRERFQKTQKRFFFFSLLLLF